MKKVFFAIAVATGLVFAACNNKHAEDAAATTEAAATEAATATEAAVDTVAAKATDAAAAAVNSAADAAKEAVKK